jgi:hypothetical protein
MPASIVSFASQVELEAVKRADSRGFHSPAWTQPLEKAARRLWVALLVSRLKSSTKLYRPLRRSPPVRVRKVCTGP